MVGHFECVIEKVEIKGYIQYAFTVPVEYKQSWDNWIPREFEGWGWTPGGMSENVSIKTTDFTERQLQILNEKFTRIEHNGIVRYVTFFEEPVHYIGSKNKEGIGFHHGDLLPDAECYPHNIKVFYELYPEFRTCKYVGAESRYIWQELKVELQRKFCVGWYLKLFTVYNDFHIKFPNYDSMEQLYKIFHYKTKFKKYNKNFHYLNQCLKRMMDMLIPNIIEHPGIDDLLRELYPTPPIRFCCFTCRHYTYDKWLG